MRHILFNIAVAVATAASTTPRRGDRSSLPAMIAFTPVTRPSGSS
jgi:hypothetical protein